MTQPVPWSGPVVMVTNELGAGLVPDNPLGRRFRDLVVEVRDLRLHVGDVGVGFG